MVYNLHIPSNSLLLSVQFKIFTEFTELCNHHQNIPSEHFHHSKKTSTSIAVPTSPLQSPVHLSSINQEKQDSPSASVQIFFQSLCLRKVQLKSRLYKQDLHSKPQLRKSERFILHPQYLLKLKSPGLKMVIPTLCTGSHSVSLPLSFSVPTWCLQHLRISLSFS